MYFTLERLLLIAVVITLISADGVYRAWRRRAGDRISPRLFAGYVATLVLGSTLAWAGFLVEWLDA
jgi:hypothetical protein